MNQSNTVTLTGDAAHTGNTNLFAGTLQIGAGGTTGALSGGGNVSLATGTSLTFNRSDDVTFSGAVGGAGTLRKLGAGTLTLTGNSSFTDYTLVDAGFLRVGDGGTTGSLTGSINVLAGTGVTFDRSDDVTYSAIIAGAGTFTKTGAGTMTVTGGLQATGGTTIAQGVLQIGGGSGSGYLVGDAAVSAGAELRYDSTSTTTWSGVISGAGALTKSGASTLTLSAANTYTGVTTINAGILNVASLPDGGVAGGIGQSSNAAANLVLNGGTLQYSGSGGSTDRQFTLGAAGGTLSSSGTGAISFTSTAPVAFSGTGARTLTLTGANSGTNTLSAAITDQSAGNATSLVKSGSGTWVLAGLNTYSGTTTVSGGTLVVNNTLNNPGGTVTVSGSGILQAAGVLQRAVTGAGTVTATGTLFLGNFGSTTGVNLSGTLNVGSNTVQLWDADQAGLGAATNIAAGGRLVTLNGALLAAGRTLTATGNAIIDGAFTNQGTVNGPTGAGQTLTFIDDVNGAGSYTGNVVFSDGFSPGNSPATVSAGNLTFDATASLVMELGGTVQGTQYDHISVSGTFTAGGSLVVTTINGFTPGDGQSFNLFDGPITGTFASVALPSLTGGLSWNTSQLHTAGIISVVPEPAVVAMLVLPVGLAVVRLLRRRGVATRS